MESIADRLRALPQLNVIKETDAQAWVNAAFKVDPTRVEWLLTRLGQGFGGSEIGALTLDAMGYTPPFASAAEIINAKLMRVPPTPNNKYMRKGIALEDAVAQAIVQVYGGVNDTTYNDTFNSPHPNDPKGLTGNIDMIWQRENERVLLDIKVPNAGIENTESFEKNFGYLCQLNTYKMLNDARELPAIDRLLNVHLEIPTTVADAFVTKLKAGSAEAFNEVVNDMVALVKYDIPGMRLHMIEQPINPDIDIDGRTVPLNTLMQEIAEINWQHVIAGTVPTHTPKSLTLDDNQNTQLKAAEETLFTLLAAQEAIAARIDTQKNWIATLCEHVNETGSLSQGAHINVKQTVKLNNQDIEQKITRYGIDRHTLEAPRKRIKVSDIHTLALKDAFVATGGDITPFLKPAPLDQAKVVEALQKHGENPQHLVTFTTSITAKRDKASLTLRAQTVEAIGQPIDNVINASLELSHAEPEHDSHSVTSLAAPSR